MLCMYNSHHKDYVKFKKSIISGGLPAGWKNFVLLSAIYYNKESEHYNLLKDIIYGNGLMFDGLEDGGEICF